MLISIVDYCEKKLNDLKEEIKSQSAPGETCRLINNVIRWLLFVIKIFRRSANLISVGALCSRLNWYREKLTPTRPAVLRPDRISRRIRAACVILFFFLQCRRSISVKGIGIVSRFTVRESVLSSRSFFAALALCASDIQFTLTRNAEREREGAVPRD